MSPCSKNCDDGRCVWQKIFQNYVMRRLQYIQDKSICTYFLVSNKQAFEKHSGSGKRGNNTFLFLFTGISQGITPTSAGIFCFVLVLRLQQPFLQLPWPLLSATTITVTNTTTTSYTSFTAKQGICVYNESNVKIKTIEQTKAKDNNFYQRG